MGWHDTTTSKASLCKSCQVIELGWLQQERDRIQEEFCRGKTRVMVATVAFGMGLDAMHVRSVIHLTMPRSLEEYVQQAISLCTILQILAWLIIYRMNFLFFFKLLCFSVCICFLPASNLISPADMSALIVLVQLEKKSSSSLRCICKSLYGLSAPCRLASCALLCDSELMLNALHHRVLTRLQSAELY